MPMGSGTASRPLIAWEGCTMWVDLAQLHAWANRELPARAPVLRRLALQGLPNGDLELEVALAWKGLPASLSVRLRQVKVAKRFFGCQVAGVRGPLGVPLPTSVVAGLLVRLLAGKATFDPSDGVFLLDLRQWLPEGMDLLVRGVRCGAESVELELGPGSLRPRAPALASGADHL